MKVKYKNNFDSLSFNGNKVLIKCSFCKKEKTFYKQRLVNLFSCGCTTWRTHNMRYTKFYLIWKGINGRCYCKSNKAYSHYGGKGITSSWKNSFLKFKEEMYGDFLIHVSKYGEKNTSIDRVDNSKGYSKENCRWATIKEQARNKKNTMYIEYNGKTVSVRELSEIKGIKYETLRRRILNNWGEERLFIQPLR